MMQTTHCKQYPLLPFSRLVSQDIVEGKGDAWVFCYTLKAEGIDVERLRRAIEYVLQHHPVFSCRIADAVQQYEAGYRTPYFAYDIREEGSVCVLNIRFHRILGDGASLVLLLTDINKVYKGEEIAADTYLQYLESQERLRASAHYTSCRQWLEQNYDHVSAHSCPKPDAAASSCTHDTEAIVWRQNIPMKSGKTAKGELLNLATALAIMDYNGTDSAALTWGYLGRETAAEMSVFGSLSRDVPFVLTRTAADSRATLMAKARTEVQQGILHSAYPYTFHAANRELWRYAVSVEVQPQVDLAIGDTAWQLIPTAEGQPREAHCFLDVEYHEAEEALLLRYSTRYYKEESIERFANLIVKHLAELQANPSAQRCSQQEAEPAGGITFMEKFMENVRLYPDKVILQDSDTKLTFRQLDELSGRVYAYLKSKGIGKEDFVMIYLPRSVKVYIAMIGVWKAGAAFVVCDTWEAKERVEYKFQDCKCKLLLNMDVWEGVMCFPTDPHYDIPEMHDAAYALYTSGSEGMPKGVVHEYGNIDYATTSVKADGVLVYQFDDRVAQPLPMSSTGGFIHSMSPLRCGAYTEILPFSLLSDLDALEKYLVENKISITGLVPSMIGTRTIESPYIKIFLTGSEMTSNIYMKEFPVLNMYGQTETSMNPLNFVIDRAYENTPVGETSMQNDVQIIDGELCVPYHFSRGYINDPELTAQVFRGGLFHTGDIARVNEDGNYVILGRKTDMIKINGNRIEPAEIEAAVKRVLGIDWAFAKGFVQPERSFICVYYTADIAIDLTAVREELLKILPNYMIPSYFVHIDDVPRLPNGKIDRQAFKAPDIDQYHAEYVAPTNEMEARLCTLMQQILEISRIGIDDDFFLLGGDSLRTIRLATDCNIDGLTVSDIYAARTPRAIAERWMQRQIEG